MKNGNQQWEQASKVRFDTYAEAAEHKATLEGRVKIRRRPSGFDVITYKVCKKQEDQEEGASE